MELIEEYKEEENNWAAYWLSEKPKEYGIGLKVVIEFDCKDIMLMEEDAKGKQHSDILMSFDEFKNLQTIIEERKGDEKEND